MRILFISSEFPPGPGGIGTHAAQLATQLSALGHRVIVLSSQDYATPQQIAAFNLKQPYQVVTLAHAPLTILEAVSKLRVLLSWLQTWQPDVVVSSGERSNWLMLAARLVWRGVWLAVGHGSEFGLSARWLTRMAFNRADRIVCVSSYTRRRMLSSGVRPGREAVINNGADENRLQILPAQDIQAYRSEHRLDGKFLLLTVGNVTLRKGHDLVIRALPLLQAAGLDVCYQIIGMPTEQVLLETLARDLGVQDQVTFLGMADNDVVLRAFNACDVYVMPSRTLPNGHFEGYGIVVTEAALCGKTSIVTRDSGLEDAVMDNQTGLLVPQEDPQAICAAVLRLAREPGLRDRLAQTARERALGCQTWRHVAKEYETVLVEMLRGNP